jgi:multicomponent Na+:H+ antiporter subunit D
MIQVFLLGLSVYFIRTTANNAFLHEIVGGWDQVIGISLRVTRLEAVFIMLSTTLFSLMLIYLKQNKENDYKFLFFFLMLQGSFNGFVVSEDLFNIFVMLELITIISTILILYKKDAHSLRAGIYYLLFNSIGMLLFLIGIIIVYTHFGSLNLNYIQSIITPNDYHEPIRFAVILFICGFGVKSAVFPVYDWLPKAHSASLTSISAILSGLLVKTGIIGLIKISLVFDGFNYSTTFYYLGIFTALLGAVFAFSQKDIKQILSFHTVSQIGLIMIAFSISIEIAMIYLINHAFIKSLLFMNTGVVINKYKERRVNKISGLWESNKLLSVLIILSALALSGFPLTSGYISKTLLSKYTTNIYQLIGLILVDAMTFASMLKIMSIIPGKKRLNMVQNKGKYFSMILMGMIIIMTGVFFTNYLDNEIGIMSYLSMQSLLKFAMEVLIGYIIFRTFSKKDVYLIRKIRHFSVNFPDGIILLMGFVLILIFTFK